MGSVHCKTGPGINAARLFKKRFGTDPNFHVMTGLVDSYNTVVVEMPMKNLAEFEKEMKDYKLGNFSPRISPEVAEEMSKYTEKYPTGRREIFQTVD